MAAITTTPGQSGARSAAFTVTGTGASDTVSNAEILEALSEGPLKKLLSATYADAPTFLAEAARQGLKVSTTGAVAVTSLVWAAAGAAPSITIVSGAAGVIVISMAVAHTVRG